MNALAEDAAPAGRGAHGGPVEVFAEIHQRQKCAQDAGFQVIRKVQAAGCHAGQGFAVGGDEFQDIPLSVLRSISQCSFPPHLGTAGFQRKSEMQDTDLLLRQGGGDVVFASRDVASGAHGTQKGGF